MKEKWKLEILGWLATVVITTLIMLPIIFIDFDFPFRAQNILLIICFITFARYFLLFKHLPFVSNIWIRCAFLFALPIMVVFFISVNSDLNLFLQDQSLEELMSNEHWDTQRTMGKYIRTEMIFFGTGSVISVILLGFRIIVSIWRTINKRGI